MTMAQSRCVTLIGDSNVKRHMNTNNCRNSAVMNGAQVVQCGRAALFGASLQSLRPESDTCIVSCITNFMTSAKGSSAVALRVEPIIIDFLSKLTACAESRPEVKFLICPPMFREAPIWYREGLPEVLQKFSDLLKNRPQNCHMMPSFPTPSFEDDGVHLTAYSGFEFVLHLFDSMTSVLSNLELDTSARTIVASESTRVLEDRVMVLEQDHRRLNRKFEFKSAVDAELSDFQENIRNESFLMIKGLPRLPKLAPKEWQVRAKADVQGVLSTVMGHECPIQFVQNSTSRAKDAAAQYRVKLPSSALSKEIRDKFSEFFTDGVDTRPPPLKPISIRNCVTAGTLARITILQLYGKRYTASNPGSKSKVIGYEPRPLLKLFPASSASDQRIQTYNFIEAVSTLPSSFTSAEVDDLLKRISPKLHGNLKALLVVVSDDMLKPKKTFTKPKPKSGPKAASGASGSESSTSPTGSSGKKSGRNPKRGAEEAASGSAAKSAK